MIKREKMRGKHKDPLITWTCKTVLSKQERKIPASFFLFLGTNQWCQWLVCHCRICQWAGDWWSPCHREGNRPWKWLGGSCCCPHPQLNPQMWWWLAPEWCYLSPVHSQHCLPFQALPMSSTIPIWSPSWVSNSLCVPWISICRE